MKILIYFILIGICWAEEAHELGFLRIHAWQKYSIAKEENLQIEDRWTGDKLNGISYGNDFLNVTGKFRKELQSISIKKDGVIYKQGAPWGREMVKIVVLNSKKCPLYHLSFPKEGEGSVIIEQVLKIPSQINKARFEHGDEELIYLEVSSKTLLKQLQQMGKNALKIEKTPPQKKALR